MKRFFIIGHYDRYRGNPYPNFITAWSVNERFHDGSSNQLAKYLVKKQAIDQCNKLNETFNQDQPNYLQIALNDAGSYLSYLEKLSNSLKVKS